jgi:hypothetical protein
VDPAGDKEYEKIKAQLLYLRKLLFAFRLIHFSDSLPDVKLNITGRDEELCSPLIRLFKNNDTKALKTVKDTLYRFIIEKKTKKFQSLDAFVCSMVKDMLKEPYCIDAINKERGIEFIDIWNLLKEKLDGQDPEPQDNRDKTATTKEKATIAQGSGATTNNTAYRQSPNKQTMVTALFGDISYRRLSKSLSEVGKKVRNHTGKKLVWQFDNEKLARFTRAYGAPPKSLEIVVVVEGETGDPKKHQKTLPLEDIYFETSDSSEPTDPSEALEKRIGKYEEEVTAQNDTNSVSDDREEDGFDKDETDIFDRVFKTTPKKPELTHAEASEGSEVSEATEKVQNTYEAQKGITNDLAESGYNNNNINSCDSEKRPHNGNSNFCNFIANSYVAFDLEWKEDNGIGSRTIYAAAFVDNHGNQKVLHISDFAGSEPALLRAITDEILKYPASIGWYTTGIVSGGERINGNQEGLGGGVFAAA